MADDTLTPEQLAELLWQVRVAEELCVVVARLQEMLWERDEQP